LILFFLTDQVIIRLVNNDDESDDGNDLLVMGIAVGVLGVVFAIVLLTIVIVIFLVRYASPW